MSQLFAIVYEDANWPSTLGDNGDVYAHSTASGDRLRKALDCPPGSGWSNAITPTNVHYVGWEGNQIYSGEEGGPLTHHPALSGGKPKDAFAFNRAGIGYFFSAVEHGRVHWFTDPTTYTTLQVTNAADNRRQVFTQDNPPIDLAFDAEDRAFLLTSAGHVWIVRDSSGPQWTAEYLTRFAPPTTGGRFRYYGIAFDGDGRVYLAGGAGTGPDCHRFLARSRLDGPEVIEVLYKGPPKSGSYGNLASTAFPHLKVSRGGERVSRIRQREPR